MSTMPTATFVGTLSSGNLESIPVPFPALSVDPAGKVDLTIHRRTKTHHGQTLRLLGHAAEYLVESRRFMMSAGRADDEAVRILMRLSREIFEEYAENETGNRGFGDWIMDRMVKLYD